MYRWCAGARQSRRGPRERQRPVLSVANGIPQRREHSQSGRSRDRRPAPAARDGHAEKVDGHGSSPTRPCRMGVPYAYAAAVGGRPLCGTTSRIVGDIKQLENFGVEPVVLAINLSAQPGNLRSSIRLGKRSCHTLRCNLGNQYDRGIGNQRHEPHRRGEVEGGRSTGRAAGGLQRGRHCTNVRVSASDTSAAHALCGRRGGCHSRHRASSAHSYAHGRRHPAHGSAARALLA